MTKINVNTRISFIFLVTIFFTNCSSNYEAYLMRSTSVDGRSSCQILMLNKNNTYEFLDTDSFFENVIKGDFGEYDVKGDTLIIKYQNYSKEYFRENNRRSKKIYPILHVIDSTGILIEKHVSGFEKNQLKRSETRKLLKNKD